jgi:S-methylmethionine-dependent homocysteine/selenocysteine methylase
MVNVNDRAHDRRRTVGAPDTIPEQHENVARGADVMANVLSQRAEEFAAQGNLLDHQTAVRQAERHRQLADYHREQADRRRDQIAGHPSTWTQEGL